MATLLNLNWNVSKKPLILEDGTSTPYFATVREDNNKVLGCVKASYQVTQNHETVAMLESIAQNLDYEVLNSYCIKGGQRIAIQLDTHKEIRIADDKVFKHLTALDSHDGSTALMFGGSDRVMSCQNQFHLMSKQLQNRFRHTKSIQQRIETTIKSIQALNEQLEVHYENYQAWAGNKVTRNLADKMLLSLLGHDVIGDEVELTAKKAEKFEIIRTSVVREMAEKGQTAWGFFNGITYYTNHLMETSQDRQELLIQGSGYDLNKKAYDLLADFYVEF